MVSFNIIHIMQLVEEERYAAINMTAVNAQSCQYCYIDVDIDDHRSNLALTAAFVDATDSRYGFCSKDLRKLGGSELSRLNELMTTDHEWKDKVPSNQKEVVTEFPSCGSRIIFKLYWDVAPLACENFATLCTNGGNSLDIGNNNKKVKPAPIGESGKELTYRNSIIHRVEKGFIIQGGDFVFGNGSGGESVYNGKKFKDEKAGLALKHDRAGILSMGNSGKNSNTSQFFVTLNKAPQCDQRHCIFGEVVSGMEVLRAVETHASDGGGEPTVPIKITNCGAYTPLVTQGAGSWYDRPDSESYSGTTAEFMVRPRVGIIAPNIQVGERFKAALAEHASTYVVLVDDKDGGDEKVIQTINPMIEKFALDVVIAAPACTKLLEKMDIPNSWKDVASKNELTLPERETIFLEAKPVNAIASILNQSWVGKRPGWLLSASFVYCNWSDLGRAITSIKLNIR